MSKRSFRVFIAITSLAISALVSIQVFWFVSSFRQESESFERLVDIAVRQIDGRIWNYFSPDYIVQPSVFLDEPDPENNAPNRSRPMAASKLLGYHSEGKDSIPIYGPKYVKDSISGAAIDSIIREVVLGLELPGEYFFRLQEHNTDSVLYSNSLPKAIPQPGKERNINVLNPSGVNQYQIIRIYFPNKIGQILIRMGWILLANVLLIILIIGTFIFAFRIILKQKRIQQIRRDFISNLTHEFKTPVSTVSLALDGLIDYPIDKDPVKRDEYLSMARKENRRLGLMIERTLNIAAYEKGSLCLKKEQVDLNDLITEVVTNFEIHVDHRQGQIVTEFMTGPSVIAGDRDHLLHVVYNLVDNANKYSPDNPLIEVRTEHGTSGWVKISVSDKGQGIPSERIDSIFEPFSRAKENDKAGIKGFGLGLAYVKKVVDLHGGSITANSKINEGSCFTIQLPVS